MEDNEKREEKQIDMENQEQVDVNVNPVETAPPPPDPLEEAQAAAKDWEKKYLYLFAEFDNFRKRMQKERLDFMKWGHEDFIRSQLQVLDNFDRALQHARSFQPEKGSPFAQVLQGVEMIMLQFTDSLKQQGVTEIKTAGEKFNPAFHEAVAEEVSNEVEPQMILKEFQRGYLLHDRLLRAAKVVTSKKDS